MNCFSHLGEFPALINKKKFLHARCLILQQMFGASSRRFKLNEADMPQSALKIENLYNLWDERRHAVNNNVIN